MEKGVWEYSEYRPPLFLESKGAPVFSARVWEQLRGLHRGLPACDDLPPINCREAARLCQWSAPGRLLGEYPLQPRVRRELIVAVTEGSLAAAADDIDACLQEHFVAIRPMALLPGDVEIRPIQFWLDLAGTPGWTGFGHTAGGTCFLIDGSVRQGVPIGSRLVVEPGMRYAVVVGEPGTDL